MKQIIKTKISAVNYYMPESHSQWNKGTINASVSEGLVKMVEETKSKMIAAYPNIETSLLNDTIRFSISDKTLWYNAKKQVIAEPDNIVGEDGSLQLQFEFSTNVNFKTNKLYFNYNITHIMIEKQPIQNLTCPF